MLRQLPPWQEKRWGPSKLEGRKFYAILTPNWLTVFFSSFSSTPIPHFLSLIDLCGTGLAVWQYGIQFT